MAKTLLENEVPKDSNSIDPENMAILSNFAAYANAIPESSKYLSEDMKNAKNIQVPDGIPVKFGQACNKESQALIDKVWTKLMQ